MIFGEGPIIKNIAGDLNKLFLQGTRAGQSILNVEGDAAANQGTTQLMDGLDPVINEINTANGSMAGAEPEPVNLLDESTNTIGIRLDYNGIERNSSVSQVSDYIYIDPTKSYTFKFTATESTSVTIICCVYRTTGSFWGTWIYSTMSVQQGETYTINTSPDVTLPANCDKIRLSYRLSFTDAKFYEN